MKRLTDNELDALEAAHRSNTPGQMRMIVDMAGVSVAVDGGYSHAHFTWAKDAEFYALACNALPALLAAARQTVPEPIGEKHRDGNWWLVWEPGFEHWLKVRWRHDAWDLGWQNLLGTPTHALPLPGRPEPSAARGEE